MCEPEQSEQENDGEAATSPGSVRNTLGGQTTAGMVVQAHTITGGIHHHEAPPRLWERLADSWRKVLRVVIVVMVSGVAAFAVVPPVVKYVLNSFKFDSPPDVCGFIRAHPELDRWVPGAEEDEHPYKIGPGTRSCTWDSPVEGATLAISVHLYDSRMSLAGRFFRIRTGEQGGIWTPEPGLGDGALKSTRSYSARDKTSVMFRLFNVWVEVDHLQDNDVAASAISRDNLVLEIATAVDGHLRGL